MFFMLVFMGRKGEIVALLLFTLALALYIGMPALSLPVPEEGKEPAVAVNILAAILAATALILLLIRLFPRLLVYIISALEALLLFVSALFILSDAGLPIALSLSAFLCFLRFYIKAPWAKNLSASIIGAFAAAILGVSLSPTVLALALALLSAYDFVAVFVTRHMMVLARHVVGEGKPAGVFGLGLGDVVFPGAFIVSTGRINPWLPIILVPFAIAGALYALKTVEKTGRGVPALPPISFSILLSTAISLAFL